MKKFKSYATALLLVVSLAFTSCSEDDNRQNALTKAEFVTTVTGDNTADINEEIALNVVFKVGNNCATFNNFIESTSGTTKTITVISKYEGNNCGTTPTTKTTQYKFKSATAGVYTLKFKKSATEFVTHTVTVE